MQSALIAKTTSLVVSFANNNSLAVPTDLIQLIAVGRIISRTQDLATIRVSQINAQVVISQDSTIDKDIAKIRQDRQKKRRIVKRLGGATSLTANLKERIKRVLKKKRLKNVSELKRELRSKLCETTLKKAVREIGAEFDSEKRPFHLSAKHKDARVEFAEE
ncbi:MAG: hypothetical protein EZS28_006304 [Streblomastix strix]|uniref:60S ribosomal protein L35 n=1 Tax=Streblomastix strix TaxID=222440 RepID=A0A5J4WT88_9EUKA|nr:MAG: hypothetical protein EZS28_006304 [Streblomastix strix]